jgi:hypothetical protein
MRATSLPFSMQTGTFGLREATSRLVGILLLLEMVYRGYTAGWFDESSLSGENRKVVPTVSWACGAAGSALPWHGRGHRFDPDQVHQLIINKIKVFRDFQAQSQAQNRDTQKAHLEISVNRDIRQQSKTLQMSWMVLCFCGDLS